ncbi:hypothetical protein T310_9633 [Rasamsonia emersonii CBS 393.64]|uniref:Ubiquitin-like domain-containing protein n=1 Tax=Rasamsonia emersonii (strain ATCC 16479 / CBS 393.64 / IMI 116815) TaxID=1408163 RepID=A0A0F4YF33_RASE3|nr:hypothetical protein T310_9633 [Rasamsonia emersonii CBS 393.64]KKA16754.1 hypothetical protein T310_9633 [Rasamsonia emersonii CBS 393.64]
MTFNITIDHTSSHDSDNSSLSDEDSSGVQVSPPSITGSHDYQDSYDVGGEWAHLPYPDEIKPSDSASRPRTSRHTRHTIHNSRSRSSRRYSRRDILPERESLSQRPRRHHSPESPESVDSDEEFVGTYARPPPDRRYWSSVAPRPVGGYAHSSSSGPSYNVYHHGGIPHGPFGHPGGSHPPSDQLVRFGHLGHPGSSTQYGNPSPYGYGPPYPHTHTAPVPPFFGHDHHSGHSAHHLHQQPQPRNRSGGHSPPQPPPPHPVPSHGNPPYGGSPFSPPDLITYGAGGYFYNQAYPVVPGGMVPPQYFGQFPHLSSPPQKSTTPPPSQSDTAKDEAIARLEKLILDERTEREAREAAREAALEKAAAEKAAAEERAAAEKKIAEEAAAKAKAEAEKKAAEDIAKAKKEAEEAAKKAAEEAAAAAAAEAAAAAAAAANNPPPEKKKPIKFKDAVGRKFSFPFHLCKTWQGMEELIRQAFLHVEVIGPHVAEGHYDLVGPNGDIILPQVWETVIEPDWTITMHMWPIPEKPKDPDPPPPPPPAAPAPEENATVEEPKKKPDGAASGPKKSRPRGPDPGSFAMWMAGSNRAKLNKTLKVEKKPEIVQQHGDTCGVM